MAALRRAGGHGRLRDRRRSGRHGAARGGSFNPRASLAARGRMTAKLGSAALFARVPGQAIPTLRDAVSDESLPPGIRGEVRFCLARLLYQTGDKASGYEQMVRSAGELRRRPALAARTMANLAAT